MEAVLEESGYTDALKLDKSPQAQGRLENLKELVQSMAGYESLEAYLEHVSLVMDLDRGSAADSVQVMTLHQAKGLEFPLVFLPGWEEGVFPSQRSMDEKGEKGLEEERRLAYVGITRAREEARISFAANRQVYGRWTSQLPSRFVDELPPPTSRPVPRPATTAAAPECSSTALAGTRTPTSAAAIPPRLAQGPGQPVPRQPSRPSAGDRRRRPPRRALRQLPASAYKRGDRVFHIKFGYGAVKGVEGNKLTVAFDKAGEKKVIDSFVEKQG